jgi:hypothetical protein
MVAKTVETAQAPAMCQRPRSPPKFKGEPRILWQIGMAVNGGVMRNPDAVLRSNHALAVGAIFTAPVLFCVPAPLNPT